MRKPRAWSLYKTFVLTTFLVVAIILYVKIVLLYFGAWKSWFMRTGRIMYWVYVSLFTWVYVQIIKYLWKWQVRVLT
jgi:hypothetical protein